MRSADLLSWIYYSFPGLEQNSPLTVVGPAWRRASPSPQAGTHGGGGGGGFLGRVCTEFSKNIYVLISDVRDSRRII